MTQELKDLMAKAAVLPYCLDEDKDKLLSQNKQYIAESDGWVQYREDMCEELANDQIEANMEFIAAACNAIPELLKIADCWEKIQPFLDGLPCDLGDIIPGFYDEEEDDD